MAKPPSYYPLRPLRYPLEDISSPSQEQAFKYNSYPFRLADRVGPENPSPTHFGMSAAPLRPQLFQRTPAADHPPLWRVIKTPLEMALLPLVAIAYLAFCYSVHGKVVPVNTYGLYSVTTQHLAAIKGGVTSISIIMISIALYPIYNIISILKSEEFFRVLASRSHGVPLGMINSISAPSFGKLDMLVAIWARHCSNHYIIAIVASLLVWIVATLAPGALTIDSVLADGELMAFAIGAIPTQSVLNGTSIGSQWFNASQNSATAASVTWAEMELGVQYSFGMANTSDPDYISYIAPAPLNLPTTTSARWLSDVIGLNPTCTWASTNLTTPVLLPFNSTVASNQEYLATAYLMDFNLDVSIVDGDFPINDSPFTTIKDPTIYVTNHTTHALAIDGSTVFLMGQCQSGCLPPEPVDFTLDLSGTNAAFTIAMTDQTWTMAILTCIPNITIETREVRNNGYGILSVQPRPEGGQLTRQGNLNPIQTSALFSIATMSLSSSGTISGAITQYSSLGSQVQGDLLFGQAQFENLPGISSPFGTTVTVTPASLEGITQGYIQIIQSATKSYLAGYLGTAYVPGRISASEIIFAASIPNLAVATAVFALLIVIMIIVHFRPGKGVEFTLVNVAAAMHGSELPAQFAQAKAEHSGSVDEHGDEEAVSGDADMEDALGKSKYRSLSSDAPCDHQDIVAMFGERRIFMQRRADGSPMLRIG